MNQKKWLILILAVIALVSCKRYFIPTQAMEDTLHVGDHVSASSVSKYEPVRGDIVVFSMPNEPGKDLIKRVIALPGETFAIKDGSVFINGKKLDEPYAKGRTEMFSSEFGGRIDGINVPAGKLVLLGDNRENSMDSRHFGYVDTAKIKYKGAFLYWNSAEFLKLNLKRFGKIK